MTDNSASDDELNCSRTVKRVLSVAGITGLGGGWLWTDQGNLAVAAALVTAALGLLLVRAELDGLTNLSGRAHRAAGRAHEATTPAARVCPDMQTARAVALVVGVGVLAVGTGLGPIADGGVASAERVDYVDDFEDNDIEEYGADTANFEVQSTTVYEGSYALETTLPSNDFAGVTSVGGLDRYPQAGDTFQVRMRWDSSDSIKHFIWAAQSVGENPDSYQVSVDANNNKFALDRQESGYNELTSTSYDPRTNADEWMRVKVEHGTDGSITATLYDSSGSQVAQLSATDTTYTEGGVGFIESSASDGSASTYWDAVEITSTNTTNGQVTDADGNAIENATVEAMNTSTGNVVERTNTTVTGEYALSLNPGDYNVTANGGTNYTAETKAVSVPEGGTSADFSVQRAGEFGLTRYSDGKPLDTDRPVTMEAYKASEYPEWYDRPTGFWADEPPVYQTSGSTLQFQNLPSLDSEYIIRYVPDNRNKNTVYETDIVYWSNLSIVGTMAVYADTETVDATVGIQDRTENQSWAPNSVTLEARNLQTDNTTDTTGLSSDTGLGELSIAPNKTSRIVAVRDDGTERHLGQVTNPVAATSEPVVFVIEDPWAADEDPRNQSAYDNTIALIEASPSGPTVGETVTLSADESTAAGANNEIDRVEWSLPDGTTPTGTEVTWTPESGDGDATHPISATVTDTNGNSDTTQVQLYVASEGAPGSGQPTAYAEVVTDEPKPDKAVRIEDRSEPPANGEIDRIEWDTTGDGTYDDGQGPFVEETYSDPGVQQVSVRTVAQSGATDVYTTTIYVAAGSESQLNQPPVAEVVVDPRDPVVGDTVSFDASNSVGIGSATIASYEWKLPDGTTATGQTASYSPSEAGAGVVELTVTDSNGREASSQGSVYVAQNASARAVPPRADFAVKTEKPKVGDPVSLEATPELDDSASIESVTWDFDGDGDFSDADGESVEFTPEEAGITEVGVQVTDSNGAESQFYEYFFVTGSASQLSVGAGGGGGGAFGGGGDLGGEGPGGLPGGAPAVLGGTATLGLLVARRAGASIPTTAIGAAGAATTAALLAPDATAAAVESVPTAGWVLGGVAGMGVALQRAGVDVRGALSNLPIIGGRK